MNAAGIRIARNGGPEVLEYGGIDVALPETGEVLIRHEAVGLNFIDTYHRSGLYPLPLPSGLGVEAAGVIEAVGQESGIWKAGDRAGYFTGPIGAYASHRIIAADKLVRLPEHVSAEAAAASMLKGCTVEFLVERCAGIEAGQWVLVHAAAGGVGSLLVPWLKALGARVIAHAGSAEKAQRAAALGAEHALSCAYGELAGQVRDLTDGRGVAVVFDGVGAASWDASLAAVKRRGLIVSYGNASGPVPPVELLTLARAGSVFLTRPTLFDYAVTPAEVQASATRLFEMAGLAGLDLTPKARFALRDAAEAHRALEGRRTTGSAVLIP